MTTISSVRRSKMVPRVELPILAASLALSVALFAAGLIVGFQNFSFLGSAAGDTPQPGWDFGSILARNFGAACLLFAGVLSGGTITLITLPMIGLYVGATAQVGVTVAGAPALLGAVAWYVPFEFAGCLMAAAAGLYPVLASLRKRRPQASLVGTYTASFTGALVLFAAGAVLILLGAGIETFVISTSGRSL